MMRRLALLLSTVAVPLALAASAAGATVTRTVDFSSETESFYACSFPLTATYTGAIAITEIDRGTTTQLIFTTVKPTTITVTNPANGKTVTGKAAFGEILTITDTSFSDHQNGLILNFVLPGQGGVLQVIGNINFSANTFSGRDTRGDTTALCNYLADP